MKLITLTTDFGLKDHRLASLKGQLIRTIGLGVRFEDISHEVSAYNIVEAAFLFESCWKQFPRGTTHLVWVYPHESENVVIGQYEGHCIVAPDNGFISLLDGDENMELKKVAIPPGEFRHPFDFVSKVVHQCISPDETIISFEQTQKINRRIALQPVYSRNEIRATFLYADRFGNVFFNLKANTFNKIRNGKPFKVFYKGMDPLTSISTSYSDVAPGEILCMFNEAGFFQISQNLGSAVKALELQSADSIQILFYE